MTMVQKSSENNNSLVNFKENVEIEEAIKEAGHGRYNLFVLVSCCILNMGSTLDLISFNVIVPPASCDLNLTLIESGLLMSVSPAGFLSALIWTYVADTRGRKPAMIVSGTVGFIVSALSSLSTNFYMMIVLKFIASTFSTASLTLTIVFLGENTMSKYRATYLFILNVANFSSDFIIFAMAYLILRLDFIFFVPILVTYKPWRLLTLLLCVPTAIGTILISFCYESPKFLANKGDMAKAIANLNRTFKINNGNCNVYRVKSVMNTEIRENKSLWNTVNQVVPIFRPPFLWRTLQLVLLLTICVSTFVTACQCQDILSNKGQRNTSSQAYLLAFPYLTKYEWAKIMTRRSLLSFSVFYTWLPTMMNSFFTPGNDDENFCQKIVSNITPVKYDGICIENGSMNTIYYGMILTFIIVLFNIAAVAFTNYRRTLIIACCLISAISCIFVNIIHQAFGNLILFFMIHVTGVTYGSIQTYFVNVYPTQYRVLATSLGYMISRFACLAGVSLIGTIIVDNCQVTFYCWSIFICCGVLLAIFLPGNEITKETSLREEQP